MASPFHRDPAPFSKTYVSRAGARVYRKALPISGIEERLDRICQAQGAEALNALRDAARKLAVPLRMEDSFRHLNAMISAMLR